MAGSAPGDSPTQGPLGLPIPHERIQIEINGQSIIGQIVHRTQRDILIRILFPYINLSSRQHVPLLAGSHASFTGDLGDSTARHLLGECYKLGRYLEQNFNKLHEAWNACHAEMDARPVPEHYGRKAMLARRGSLKNSFKKGELTPQQYQLCVSQLKKANEDFDIAQRRSIATFLESHFPKEVVNVDLGGQVIPLLESEMDFISSSIPPLV